MILRKVYKKREKVSNYSITFSPCLFFSNNEIYHPGESYIRRYSFSFTSQILHQFFLSPVDSGISFTIEFPELLDIGRQRIQLFLQLGRISIPGHFLYSSLQGLVLLHQLVVMAEQDFYLLLVRQVFVHFMHKHFSSPCREEGLEI